MKCAQYYTTAMPLNTGVEPNMTLTTNGSPGQESSAVIPQQLYFQIH